MRFLKKERSGWWDPQLGFNSLLQPTILKHSELQVIVKKSGDVSQVWSKEDADRMWNEGEVLLGSKSLSTLNLCCFAGTPPYWRPRQPDFEETWKERGSGKVFDLIWWRLLKRPTSHHQDHQVPPTCSRGRLLYDLQPGTGRDHWHPPTLQEISF